MAIRFGDAVKAFAGGQEVRRKKYDDSVDALVKEAQIKELGYDIQPSQGRFGPSLVERPGFTSLKDLQKQKLERELDPNFMTAYQRAKLGAGGGLTSGQKMAKDKATTEIFGAVETNKVKRNTLDNAIQGANTVPSGFFGKQKLKLAKSFPATKGMFGVTDQNIQDAQELKMALTEGTLAETAHTKGAISDSEMMLFREAAANDDFNSPAIQPVLQKIRAYMDADEAGMFGAYQKNYGEDPRQWFGQPEQGGGERRSTEFNSPEEADASGLPPGTVVTVQGRKYQI